MLVFVQKIMHLLILLLLLSCNGYATDYTEALTKARDAAYIQSGLSTQVTALSRYAENKAKLACHKMNIEKPIDILFFSYYTYKQQKLTIPLMYRSKLNVQMDVVAVEIPISF